MYKEEKIINGILHYRTSPNVEFKPYTLEDFTGIVGMLKEEMQNQQKVDIKGKDTTTLDCTNPKGGAIPKIGTKEFNDLASAYFGGKPKQQTAVEWLELNLLGLISFDSEELRAKYKDRVAKAKEMEEQQHKETWVESTSQFTNESEMVYKKAFEQYYNETFKTQLQG